MEDGYLHIDIRASEIEFREEDREGTLNCPRLLTGLGILKSGGEHWEVEITEWLAGNRGDQIGYRFRRIRKLQAQE